MNKKEQIEKCFEMIKVYADENNYDDSLRALLNKYLGNYLRNRRVPTLIELELKLKSLKEASNSDLELARKVITRALENGWGSFYPIGNTKSVDNIPQRIEKENKPKRMVLVDEEF